MKIGITANVNLGEPNMFCLPLANVVPNSFIEIVTAHQQVPIILPVVPVSMVKELVESVDGIIIPGGEDIDPQFFNEHSELTEGNYYVPHDKFEIAVIKEAVRTNTPLFGVCRGLQVMNVAFGGNLYQDLPTDEQDKVNHEQRDTGKLYAHDVQIKPGSNLEKSLGQTTPVNSRHHQALKDVANDLDVVATAADGVVEAVEYQNGLLTGVQWHPEDLWKEDQKQEQLFANFFKQVENNKE